jgi:hypothetical protein
MDIPVVGGQDKTARTPLNIFTLPRDQECFGTGAIKRAIL